MLIVDAERMSYIRNRSKDPRGSTRSYIDKSTRGIAQLKFKYVYSFKQTLLNYVFFPCAKHIQAKVLNIIHPHRLMNSKRLMTILIGHTPAIVEVFRWYQQQVIANIVQHLVIF